MQIEYIFAAALYLLSGFVCFYGLWLFFIAVMNIKRVRDMGLLTPFAHALAMPILFVGLFLDLVCDVVFMTLIMLELPQEMTVTSRLKRHHRESTGDDMLSKWRMGVVLFLEPILDPFDPSGDHV